MMMPKADRKANYGSGGGSNGASQLNPPQLELLNNLVVPESKDIRPPFKKWEMIDRPTDVVILTANEEEFLNCYPYLENVYSCHRIEFGKFYFGEIMNDIEEKVKVSLVRCDETANAERGSLTVTMNLVVALKPKVVICAGFCRGLNRKKTNLGDVVFSWRLATYAHKKLTKNGVESRGVKPSVSRNMGYLIKSVKDGYIAPLKNPESLKVEIHNDKVMLSGPMVEGDEIKKLLEKHPDAYAIEMEGEGVYAAAFDCEIEWVVIKGIADFAVGSTEEMEKIEEIKEWRSFASAMAASVIHHMLKQPCVLDGWRHHGDA